MCVDWVGEVQRACQKVNGKFACRWVVWWLGAKHARRFSGRGLLFW
jgi:hypothetical protein